MWIQQICLPCVMVLERCDTLLSVSSVAFVIQPHNEIRDCALVSESEVQTGDSRCLVCGVCGNLKWKYCLI